MNIRNCFAPRPSRQQGGPEKKQPVRATPVLVEGPRLADLPRASVYLKRRGSAESTISALSPHWWADRFLWWTPPVHYGCTRKWKPRGALKVQPSPNPESLAGLKVASRRELTSTWQTIQFKSLPATRSIRTGDLCIAVLVRPRGCVSGGSRNCYCQHRLPLLGSEPPPALESSGAYRSTLSMIFTVYGCPNLGQFLPKEA